MSKTVGRTEPDIMFYSAAISLMEMYGLGDAESRRQFAHQLIQVATAIYIQRKEAWCCTEGRDHGAHCITGEPFREAKA